MRTSGSPAELEYRRRLAVERVREGYPAEEVADWLGVAPRSVRRWVASFHRGGPPGLAARPVPGRPPALTAAREKVVRRWLAESPTGFGFVGELWTAPRLAALMGREWGWAPHPNYLAAWLRARGFSPQRPRRSARERDAAAVARWLAEDWKRIKKRPAGVGRSCC